jgi:hypothetical protein
MYIIIVKEEKKDNKWPKSFNDRNTKIMDVDRKILKIGEFLLFFILKKYGNNLFSDIFSNILFAV